MSFSSETKSELCKLENKKSCCERAEGYGLMLFSKAFSVSERFVAIENPLVARRTAEFAASVAGVIPTLTVNLRRKGYILSIPGIAQREELFATFGHVFGELEIHGENLADTCCTQAFLRGAFLSCGTVADPNKLYQLEFVVSDSSLAAALANRLKQIRSLGFLPGVSKRSGSFVVYFKDSRQIENLLTYMGATGASMELMQIKMYKEAVGDINRKSNFETANIDKTYSASARQTAAIALIVDTTGLNSLGDDLRAVAELRLHNPDMTLKDMAAALHISRSGVNHKLQRLLAMARDLQADTRFLGKDLTSS